jgi:hypothetical protein
MVMTMKARRSKAILLAFALSGAVLAAMPAYAGPQDEKVRAAVEQSTPAGAERDRLLETTGVALRAGVAAGDLEVIVLRGTERGLSPGQVRDLVRIAADAGGQSLPVRAVLDRIEEGLAKGVPAERILNATRRLAGTLAAAGPLVDGLARNGLHSSAPGDRGYAVETVARALERSVPETAVKAMGDEVRTNNGSMAQFDRAVRSLTVLAGSGMPLDTAERMIRRAVSQGFGEADFARLERKVADMTSRGASVSDVVHAMERELREDRGSGDRANGGGLDRGGGARDAGSRAGRVR